MVMKLYHLDWLHQLDRAAGEYRVYAQSLDAAVDALVRDNPLLSFGGVIISFRLEDLLVPLSTTENGKKKPPSY